MADAADIESVKDLLPTEADGEGWDTTKITIYLDAGKSIPAVLQTYWEGKVAKFHAAISISESGSSRDLSRLFENAKALAEYWRDRVKADEEEADKEEEEQYSRIRFNRINRV